MCCPYTRRASKASRPVYGTVTSFLHSLIIQSEPRFAMFGPGLEELNTSLVLSLMSSEELCPTAGLPHRQIDGNLIFMLIYSTSNSSTRNLMLVLKDGHF